MHKKVLLSVALLGLSTVAHAENLTQVAFGCAPWDGQTLEISVGAPDVIYKASVWGEGLAALRNSPQKITLGGDADMKGNGYGSVCGTRDGRGCHGEALSVVFDIAELKEGGAVSGAINFRGMMVPFSGILHGSQPCG